MKIASNISRYALIALTLLFIGFLIIKSMSPATQETSPDIQFGDAQKTVDDPKPKWSGKLNKKKHKTGVWTLVAPDGQKLAIANYVDDDLNGSYLKFYPNGRKKSQGTYKANLLTGEFSSYYDNEANSLSSKGHFTKGHKVGKWQQWSIHNNLTSVVYYKAGLKHGSLISYVNEKQYRVYQYRMGVLNGTMRKYSMSNPGKVTQQGLYKNGKQEGLWQTWTSDGKQLRVTSQYQSGSLNGLMIKYNERGLKWKTWTYRNHKLNGPYIEYLPGKRNHIITTGQFLNGNRSGIWKSKYRTGKVWTITPYLKDNIHGIVTQYYTNGRLWKKVSYKNDKRSGEYIVYSNTRTSRKLLSGQYENNLMHGKWTYWYPDGKSINNVVLYNKGVKHGFSIRYYPSGRQWEKSEYTADALNGVHIEYYDDPRKTKKVLGHYKQDDRIGKWTYWNYKGKLTETIIHKEKEKTAL